MEKIKNYFKKLRRAYRRRKLYKLAETDASIMCGSLLHILPKEVYIEGNKETMMRETRRILYKYKAVGDNWPPYDNSAMGN